MIVSGLSRNSEDSRSKVLEDLGPDLKSCIENMYAAMSRFELWTFFVPVMVSLAIVFGSVFVALYLYADTVRENLDALAARIPQWAAAPVGIASFIALITLFCSIGAAFGLVFWLVMKIKLPWQLRAADALLACARRPNGRRILESIQRHGAASKHLVELTLRRIQ